MTTGISLDPVRTVGDTPKGGTVLAFYAPKGTPRPPRVARGEGIFLWDENGRRYLDATAGAVVANIGHGNPRVLAAIQQEQASRVTFAYPRFFESEYSVALSDRVCELAGEGLLTAIEIEIVADKGTCRQLPVEFNAPARLTEHGLKHGIALYNRRANLGAFGDIQLITPPLTISEPEIDELAELLEKSLSDLADEIACRGLADEPVAA